MGPSSIKNRILYAKTTHITPQQVALIDETSSRLDNDRTSTFSWYSDWWLPEILGWIISLLCMVAIIVVLNQFDNRPLPVWSYGITLNTVISILATIAKIAFMLPITEGISQLKWTMYTSKQSRTLSDFDDVDQASRGLFGSARVIFAARYW